MKKIITLFFLFVVKIIFSQDIHFSQYHIDRLYFNPANVGDIEENDNRNLRVAGHGTPLRYLLAPSIGPRSRC